jgi:O-methyltransferase involved in polyketide biosynthesis
MWRHLGLPYAEHFATPRGALMFWSLRCAWVGMNLFWGRTPKMEHYLAYRHRLIEGELARLDPDCVVELGAGLSRRGVTWAADRGVRYVEVDLPAMVAAKQHFLAEAPQDLRARLGDRLSVVVGDVCGPEFHRKLREHIAGARRPVVIAEGLMGYFDKETQARVAAAVAEAFRACGGGFFLCDQHASDELAGFLPAHELLRLGIYLVTGGYRGRIALRDHAEIRQLFVDAGFTSVERVEPSVHLAAYPVLRNSVLPVSIYALGVR